MVMHFSVESLHSDCSGSSHCIVVGVVILVGVVGIII